MPKMIYRKKYLGIILPVLLLAFGGRMLGQGDPLAFRLAGATVAEKDTFTIAVYSDSFLSGRGIYSYRFYLTYSPVYLEYLGIEGTGPVLSGWGNPLENNTNAGTLILAGAGADPLSGSGVMVHLRFRAVRSGGASISFNTSQCYLNEGNPPSTYTNGYVSISALSYPNIAPDQANLFIGDEVKMSTSGGVGPYVYSTSDPAVAVITSGDTVRAVGPGTTRVSVTDAQGEVSTTTGLFDIRAIRLSMGVSDVWPADTFYVPVILEIAPGTSVYSGRFELAHSTALSGLPGNIIPGDFQVLVESNPKSGRMSVSFASATGITGNGILCYLPFRANSSGNQYIRYENMRFNETLLAWTTLANYFINVRSLPTLYMSPNSGTIMWGELLKLNVTNGTAPYHYVVSDPEIASIDEQGNLTGITGGQVRVSVTDDNGASMTSGVFTITDHRVSVFSTEGTLDADTRVPIISSSLPGDKEILGYQAVFTFDQNYLTFQRAEAANGSGLVAASVTGNTVRVAGAYATGISTGLIGYLVFEIKNTLALNSSTPVNISSFSGNENSLFTSIQGGTVKRVEQTSYRPIAIAGLDFSIQEGTAGQLDGTASFDLDNDPLTYTWIVPQGMTLDDPSSATPGFTAPYVSANTVYTFKLVVNDGSDDSDTATVKVTVLQVNNPPVANAGADRNYVEGSSVNLDGTASFDPDGDALSYSWQALDAIILFDPTSPTPSLILPQVTQNTTYRFTLVVNDGAVNSPKDTVFITSIQVNKKPVAFAGADFSVNENESATLNGSLSYDADNDPLTFHWTAPAGITLSDINAARPSFTAPAVLHDSALIFSLIVNDGNRNSDPDQVRVSVINIDILKTGVLVEDVTLPQLDSSAIDTTLALVTLYLPYGTDIRTLAPVFTLSEGAHISPASGTTRNFTTPVYYLVTAEDAISTKLWKVVVHQPDRTVRRNLLSGWNWLSLNVQPVDRSITTLFSDLALSDLDYVKSSEYSSVYYNETGWFGNLVIFPQNRYIKFRKNIAEDLVVTGREINAAVTSIPLLAGWNDIAYLLRSNGSIDEVFRTNTFPAGNLLLKTASGSSIYYPGTGWVGDIDSLRVLHGYRIHVENPGQLMFETGTGAKKSALPEQASQNSIQQAYDLHPENFEHSAILIAEAVSMNGTSITGEGDVLLACYGSEIRGVARARYVASLDRFIFVLTYFSNEEQEDISFRLHRSPDETEYLSNLVLGFAVDEITGLPDTPYALVFDAPATGIAPGTAVISVYPNPVSDLLTVRAGQEIRELRLLDITGKQVLLKMDGGSIQTLSMHSLPPGIYTLELETDHEVCIRKIIKASKKF